MAKTTILLADDHPIFLEGLKSFLSKFPEFLVKAAVRNGEHVLQLLQTEEFDLLILDVNLPNRNGLDVLLDIQQLPKKPAVLMLSMYSESDILEVAIRRGANAYVNKNTSLEELYSAIEEVGEGGFYLSENLSPNLNTLSLLKEEPIVSPQMNLIYKLTQREGQILSLIAATRTNKQIAALLNISDQTVGVHRKNILRKFGVHNTTSLIRKVFEFERLN